MSQNSVPFKGLELSCIWRPDPRLLLSRDPWVNEMPETTAPSVVRDVELQAAEESEEQVVETLSEELVPLTMEDTLFPSLQDILVETPQ